MTVQYLRRFSVIVATAAGQGLELGQLRCTFHITRGDLQSPNTAWVRIYNLDDATARKIEQVEFSQIALQTGWGPPDSTDPLTLMFFGNIIQGRRGRENQLETYVDITAADGDEPYNFAFVSQTLPQGSSRLDAIQSLIATMAAPVSGNGNAVLPGYTPADLGAVPNLRPRVLFGYTKDVMRQIAQGHDLNWSIQDGTVNVVPLTTYIPGSAVVISPSTGLLGVPEQTQNGLSIRVLLNPQIKIGYTIRLDSTVNQFQYSLDQGAVAANESLRLAITRLNADGLYYVMRADHAGDTRGEQWETELTCLAIDATAPREVLYKPVQGYMGPGPIVPNAATR